MLLTCLQFFNATIDMFTFIPSGVVENRVKSFLLTCLQFSNVIIDMSTFILQVRGVVGDRVP